MLGRIWYSAVPHYADGSRISSFTDLAVGGETDDVGGSLLASIAHRRQGNFKIDARLEAARNGGIAPYANGIYGPVRLHGDARVGYDPK